MQLISSHMKLIRYAILGGATAAIEFMSFIILVQLISVYAASMVSFVIGLAVSFLFNKFLVFNNSKKIVKPEVLKYLLLGIVNSQLSSGVTLVCSLIMPSYLAKACTMAVIAMWNYAAMNKVIFKKLPNHTNL